jgi:hypothetical protein
VQDANGFDESLLFGEDWDLWQRLARELGPKVAPVTFGRTRVVHTRFEDSGEAIEAPEGVEVARAQGSQYNRPLGVAELAAGPGAMPMRAATAVVLNQHRSKQPSVVASVTTFNAGAGAICDRAETGNSAPGF